jgi:hypothetical protein
MIDMPGLLQVIPFLQHIGAVARAH